MQGTTDVAFTVLDVLGYLDEIPVCTGYEIDGKVTTDFPTTGLLEKAKPVFEVLPGWKTDPVSFLPPYKSEALRHTERQSLSPQAACAGFPAPPPHAEENPPDGYF